MSTDRFKPIGDLQLALQGKAYFTPDPEGDCSLLLTLSHEEVRELVLKLFDGLLQTPDDYVQIKVRGELTISEEEETDGNQEQPG